jgi:uncharacterized protein YecT (DUF1311 family)
MIYTVGNPMKVLIRLSAAGFCLALLAGAVSCRKETKAKEVANVSQDTMLLRDLAEANRNTANAAVLDNSLTTVRGGDGALPTLVNDGSQNRPTNRAATQPAGSELLTSGGAIKAPTTANDAPAPTTVPTERAAVVRATASSGDPCDSPTSVDQRYCLNRSIVANDADLNRTYQELIAQSRKSGGDELEERFRQSQREWINDRDAACRQSEDTDGKLWARARAKCLASYSNKRTSELQRSLSSLRGQ